MCDVNNFICEFRQKLIHWLLQEWHSNMVSRDRLALLLVNQSHFLADYVCIIKKAVLRRNLVAFRLWVSPLKAHCLRYTDRSQENYACIFRKDTDESEIHFLFVCPKYKMLRETYLLETFYLFPSAFKMAMLLADTRQTSPLAPAIFISKAFKLRSSAVPSSLNTLDDIS